MCRDRCGKKSLVGSPFPALNGSSSILDHVAILTSTTNPNMIPSAEPGQINHQNSIPRVKTHILSNRIICSIQYMIHSKHISTQNSLQPISILNLFSNKFEMFPQKFLRHQSFSHRPNLPSSSKQDIKMLLWLAKPDSRTVQ